MKGVEDLVRGLLSVKKNKIGSDQSVVHGNINTNSIYVKHEEG